MPNKIRRQVEVPSTEYSYQVYKNVCSNNVMLKGIRKIRTSTGQILYEDASFVLKAGETTQDRAKFVDDYDAQNAEIGSTTFYKNTLSINPATYNTYVNSVTNNPTGTLVINSTTSGTRIFVNTGDKVSIKADGSVRLGMFAGSGGPNGIDGFTAYNTSKNAKHGSLIYRIGDDSNWYFVGSNATINAHRSGTLRLTVNDDNTSDNEGQFIVNYEIIRANSSNNTSNNTTNNVSSIEDNKFVIRNNYKSSINFELSRDKSSWTSFSLKGLSQSDYWYTDQQQSFFRIKMLTEKVYKIEAGKKYKLDWNKSEWCFDLFSDGDR